MTYTGFGTPLTSAFILEANRETDPRWTLQRWRSIPELPPQLRNQITARPGGPIRALSGIWLQESTASPEQGIRAIYAQDVDAAISLPDPVATRILNDFENAANRSIEILGTRCR